VANVPRKRDYRDVWLCVDCTILSVNGDASGIDPARLTACESGLDRLGEISPNWTNDEENGCGSRLAGEMHRFAHWEAS
jgi:hypothetical protein